METLFKDSAISKGFLVAEHLTQDLTHYSHNKKNEAITLENIQRIKHDPYSNMSNLIISDQIEKLAHDVSLLPENIGYILDLTTRFHGLDLDKIHRI